MEEGNFIMKRILTLIAVLCLPQSALAAPPDVPSPSPVLFLADNLDEPGNLGFCLDTVGRGFGDRLHAHSCKPQGGDTQFEWQAANGTIHSVGFQGYCAAIKGVGSEAATFHLDTCADAASQVFEMTSRGLIHPASNTDLCLGVEDTTRRAGPFVKRALVLADCASTPSERITWVQRR